MDPRDARPTLKDVGIDKNLADRAQNLARAPTRAQLAAYRAGNGLRRSHKHTDAPTVDVNGGGVFAFDELIFRRLPGASKPLRRGLWQQ